MTTATIQQLRPRFKFGATFLDFPDPSMSPETARAAYEASYPFVRTATIGDPVAEGGFLTYPLVKPQVQVKGAGDPADALAALDDWRDSQQVPNADTQALFGAGLFGIVQDILKRPPTPMTDAFLIPMA